MRLSLKAPSHPLKTLNFSAFKKNKILANSAIFRLLLATSSAEQKKKINETDQVERKILDYDSSIIILSNES